jgi:hypothetical protein
MAQYDKQLEDACRIWFCPTDESAASELWQLPRAQREKIWADLSGDVNSSHRLQEEDSEMVTQRLAQLNDELSRIPDKPDFSLAQKASPEYTDSRSFRLMFLRSTDFDAMAAAARIVGHFKGKRELFGPELLGRDIQLSDLDQDELETLASGGMNFLPRTDAGGRLVVFSRHLDFKSKKREDVVRLKISKTLEM